MPTVIGNANNNTLAGTVLADTLIGLAGDDSYTVNHVGDVVIEEPGEGQDTVNTSVSFTLGANIESLVLTGTAAIDGSGNDDANTILGNAANNSLFGGEGNDFIDGGAGDDTLNGGNGADELIGGYGNDTYVVDSVLDRVTEWAGAGTDTVLSAISYALGVNVENLTLTGTASNSGTGNALNNVLIGNDGANRLDGGDGNDTLIGGAGNDNLLGGNGNDLLDGGTGADIMVGGAGNDIYVVNNRLDVVTEQSDAGTDTVQSSISYTLGANLENLTLIGTAYRGTGNAGNNRLTGNAGVNVLSGGEGDDTLDGGANADPDVVDTLIGGSGNDTYVVDSITDTIIEAANGGTDTVQSSVTYTLGDNLENLTLTGTANLSGTGNTLGNLLRGNAGNNSLDGGSGNDTLIGGGGADTLHGGSGNDTYVVDSITDTIIEAANGGTDTVQSSVTYTLGDNLENLTLTGTANLSGTGNTLGNLLKGNDGNNRLDGGSGDDTLIGGGGADTLLGGSGNDLYVVDSTDTIIVEDSNGGVDTVQSAMTYTLGANLENLILSGTANRNGTGNTLGNLLEGNAGNNRLDGGAGADTLVGGAGNDTYVVDNTGDIVIEGAGEGTDTVQSSVSFTLGANTENLILSGTANRNGTGNAMDNRLTGNAGNNRLDGGLGADTLIGGAGDDTYVADSSRDQVTENAGEGTDTVLSAVSYALGANIENLTLTGTTGNSATGNALDNVLSGNDGANRLDGGDGNDTLIGGVGVDQLYGGVGADAFKFVTTAEGGDRILDFTTGLDRIEVVSRNFSNLPLGSLTAGRFVSASTPLTNGNAVFLYNPGQGLLSFDADGNGGGAAVPIATLSGGKALFSGDIYVVAA